MLVAEEFRTEQGAVVGALVRNWSGTSLHTLSCFVEPDESLHEVESRIEFDSADPFSFTHLVHLTPTGTHRRSHPGGTGERILPGHAEFLIVRELAGASASDSHQVTCLVLDEVTGHAVDTLFQREGDMIVRRVGDQVEARHQVSEGEVVSSDWGGGWHSVVLPNVDDLLESVPHPVQQRLARFLDDLERA